MEEKLENIFASAIKQHRVRTLRELMNEIFPVFQDNGFTFDDLLNALADYANDSDDLVLHECMPCIERTINHLRKLQARSNHE
ncbi:MAG: hypothetical protein KME29_31585 [Calothrix sp. FI2-JRJ7]|jgi:hypothetical protein|nr:hypothetical protein [Calothrix sp. FI2-JRJ7]